MVNPVGWGFCFPATSSVIVSPSVIPSPSVAASMLISRMASSALLMCAVSFLNGCAMAKETVLLWPAIEGQILNQGKAVPDLELTQTLYWNYEPEGAAPRVAVAKTDERGQFRFPKITGEVKPHFLFRLLHQPGILLSVDVVFDGRKINLLSSIGSSYSGSSSQRVLCDLANVRLFKGDFVVDCDIRGANE